MPQWRFSIDDSELNINNWNILVSHPNNDGYNDNAGRLWLTSSHARQFWFFCCVLTDSTWNPRPLYADFFSRTWFNAWPHDCLVIYHYRWLISTLLLVPTAGYPSVRSVLLYPAMVGRGIRRSTTYLLASLISANHCDFVLVGLILRDRKSVV